MSSERNNPSRARIYALLTVAISVVSFASIFIKLAEAPSIVIAAWRLGLATLLLTPAVWARRRSQLNRLSAREWLLCLVSGVFLSMHFIAWISSLKYTSVASSVVLVTVNPIFVGLGAHFLLREPLRKLLLLGIVIAVAGGVLIGLGDFQAGSDVLWGDFLALVGALMASSYFLVGRRLRRDLDLLTYVFVVYGMAALVLLLAVGLSGESLLGYTAETYLWMVLLALGPQLFGHTAFNWALKYIPAASVAVVILGEPVGSTLLAYLILNEGVGWLKLVGGVLVLTGIYVTTRSEPSPQATLSRASGA